MQMVRINVLVVIVFDGVRHSARFQLRFRDLLSPLRAEEIESIRDLSKEKVMRSGEKEGGIEERGVGKYRTPRISVRDPNTGD